MAAVLDALAPYVKKLITDMAEEEVSMLLGVSGEITKLEVNMEGIKDFLVDAERRRLTDLTAQRWVRKLKDAMYDATDIIDLCHLEADKRTGSTEDGSSSVKDKVPAGCFQPLLFCLRNPVFAHKIGIQIKELNQRLDNIRKEADRFKSNVGLGSNPEPWKLITCVERSTQETSAEIIQSDIVGEKIEQDTRELAQLLITSGSHDFKVVSIVGPGGMGKTTLAQKIFNDTSVQENFKVKVWLSITQDFHDVVLLRAAIKHAGGDPGNEYEKTLLTRTLTNTLSTGRFLLVLDDVWSVQAWSPLLRVPISNASQIPISNASQKQPGNWVLITSRFGDLAQQMGAPFHQHHVSPLNEEDAWALLNKQLPPQEVGTDHLRNIGMKIITKCGGLPLAVKVMGGLLSTKPQSEVHWEAVLNHRAWSVDGLPEKLDKRIYLSYEDLSPELKQCFLYCSLFPKGIILQRNVVPMWISEGFIQPQGRSSYQDDRLEESANEYYRELITRNLIEPTKEGIITRYKCTMHNVVRSFAEYMSREESLVVEDSKQVASGSSLLVRRMSVGPRSELLLEEWAALQKQVSLRTLFINGKINCRPGDTLTCFSRLRVLFINKGGECDMLVGSVCQLIHLRYLALERTNISMLPENIHKMKFLQHIVLVGSTNLESLPSSIIKLVHLRTLIMDGLDDIVIIPKGFGELSNLRILKGFPAHMDMDGGWCSLEEIGHLDQLRELSLYGLENVPDSLFAEMARINSKENLNYLELLWSSRGWMEEQQRQHIVEEVLEKLCPPPRIQHLHIQGYFGRMLPNWMMVPYAATWVFMSLMILALEDLPSCTKLPDGLCRLLCLESLDIKNAPAIKSVGFEFQASSSLTAVGGGGTTVTSLAFPRLTHLVLKDLCEWEEWDWEEQATVDVTTGTMAMPALEVLTIHNCKLSCLPPGLANSKRHALRQLYLYELTNLTSVDNFPSVVDLNVLDCPELKRISGLSRLHKIRIVRCPNLEVLEGVPALDSLVLEDATMEALPGYLPGVNPRYLEVDCCKKLYDSLSSPGTSVEWNKISHIRNRNIINIED